MDPSVTAASRPPINVHLTVDVEFWPTEWRIDEASVGDAVARDIYGETKDGRYGLSYMLQRLNKRGLEASFFVEALHAEVVGCRALNRMVDQILHAHQDVQLHAHSEWRRLLPGHECSLHDYAELQQRDMIGSALSLLRVAGAPAVRAFRAGNYGANLATLRALAFHGITFDTSYNQCTAEQDQWEGLEAPLQQPTTLEGIVEIPITSFQDRPGHHRHAQLSACSWTELRTMLDQAWQSGRTSFVIVLHSFELIDRLRRRADPVAVARFEELCRYLDTWRCRYRTAGFDTLSPQGEATPAPAPLRSSWRHTAGRVIEQLGRRVRALAPETLVRPQAPALEWSTRPVTVTRGGHGNQM